MNSRSEISIIGFSSIASATSLLLAQKKIEHTYHIKKIGMPFLSAKPLSNPLVNGPTVLTERIFISNNYADSLPLIIQYESVSLNNSFKQYRVTKGNYASKTYAIDNRIRLHCFAEKIKQSNYINLVEHESIDNIITLTSSKLNIVGGGEALSSMFNQIEELPTNNFLKRRKVCFLNLTCDNKTYKKYANKVKIFYIDNVCEILIYPFLHPNKHQTLNITLNIIDGGTWDCFDNNITAKGAFNKLISILSDNLNELASDFKDCELADDCFSIHKTTPYYKYPTITNNQMLFMGVGESITKSDPLIGQGYNSGLDMGVKLVEFINKHTKDLDYELIKTSYTAYASRMMTYLYHINRTSTQTSENRYLHELYNMAAVNKDLCDYLFSTYDDISRYFPWLINEEETKILIKKFNQV